MKFARGWIRFSFILLALVGCATREERPEISTPPSSDELPKIEFPERRFPAAVHVQGREHQPRTQLVQKYEPPELTEEEKKALGIEEPIVDLLEFYQPMAQTPLLPYLGGVETATYGRGGASVGRVTRGSYYGLYDSSSMQVHYDNTRVTARREQNSGQAKYGHTPDERLQIGSNVDSRRARPDPRSDQ